MATDENTTTVPLAQVVRSNIRAELARRDMTPGALMAPLGLSESAVYRRFSDTDPILFKLDEVDTVAKFLNVSTDRLTARNA